MKHLYWLLRLGLLLAGMAAWQYAFAQTYCTPTSTCGSGGDGLVSVRLGTNQLSLNNGCPASGGYNSFTLASVTVTPGTSYPISGTFTGSNYDQDVSIWIDVNKDGIFTTDEQVYKLSQQVLTSFSGTITIPAGISPGTLRMRIRICDSGVPENPCTNTSYGETEDYILTAGIPTTYSPYTSLIGPYSARLNWNNLGTATSYDVQWRPAGGNYTLINGISSTTYALTGLTTATTYEWQMRPANTTTWIGGPVTFITQYPCTNTPTLSEYSITSKSANISWSFYNQDYPNQTYDLQIQVTGTTSWSTLATSTTLTSYNLTNLTPGTSYTYRVRAACSDYTTRTFLTLPCAAPTSQQSDFITSSSVRLQWYENDPASNLYTIRFWKTSTPSSVSSITGITGVQYTNYYFLTGLTNSTQYSWTLQKQCTGTVSAPNSPTSTFTTACNIPTNLSSGYIGRNSARLSWYSNGPLVTYDVQIRVTGASAWSLISGVSSNTTSTYTDLSLNNLSVNTAYEWQVRTNCGGGITSAYTAIRSFTTTCATPSAPSLVYNGASYDRAALYLYTNNLNTPHELQYRPVGTTAWSSVTINVGNAGSTSPASYTLTDLATGTTYQVQLRAQCGVGSTSPFSSTSSFQTLNCRPVTNLQVNNIALNSARLSWYGDYQNPAGAIYELQYRPVNTPVWTTVSSLSFANYYSPVYSLTALTSNTTYEWQVRAFCTSTGSSTYTTGSTFRVECISPTYLSHNVGFNTAQLSWSGPSGASFEVQWQQQGSSEWNSVTTTNYYYQLTNISGVYNWRVRSVCTPTESSTFAGPMSFTTICNAPSYISVNNISSYAAQANWQAITGNPAYTIRWRQLNTANWNNIDDLTRNSEFITGLLNATAYEVQAAAKCSAIQSSTYTTSYTFITGCSAPNSLNQTASYDSPTTARQLQWSGITGTSYVVEWQQQGMSVWNISPVLNQFSYQSFNYTLYGLTQGVGYNWRVKTVCADGLSSDYSNGASFTLTCNTAPPTTYNSTPTWSKAYVYWSGSSLVPPYELRWRPVSGTVWNMATELTSSSFNMDSLTGNTAYEWQVRVLCPLSATTSFGPSQTFATSCQPATNPYVCGVSNSIAKLSWYGPDDASFVIQWRQKNTTNWNIINSINTTSFTLTGLNTATAYEWQVQTVCGAISSTTFSNPVSFTTSCISPTYLDAYAQQCNYVSLYWNGCSGGISRYDLRYRTAANPDNWTTLSNLTTTSQYIYSLQPNTTYIWQVRTRCSENESSPFSQTATFTTPACTGGNCDPATNSYEYGITSTAAGLSWSGTGPFNVQYRQGYTSTWSSLTANYGTILSNLTADTPYDWRVQSLCSGNGTSAFSQIDFFRTVCNIPFNPQVSTYGLTPTSARLSWDNFVGTSQFEIQWRQQGASGWNTISNVMTASYSLTGLNSNTAYEFRVKTLCNGGGSSAYSHAVPFQTACSKPTSALTRSITRTSAIFSWYISTSGSPQIELQYRAFNTDIWTTVITVSTSYTATDLLPNTAYEWRLRTLCTGNPSPYLPVLTFQTPADVAPPCLSMVSIKNGNWDDPSVWSCNRIPNNTDLVLLKHTVVIPENQTARALRVTFDNGARLLYQTNSRLLIP